MSLKSVAVATCGSLVALGVGGVAGYLIADDSSTESPVQPSDAPVAMVSECGVKEPVARPAEITMTCADGGVVLHDIDWRYWSNDLAVGLASSSENTCDPTCAEGSMVDHAVNVVLFDIVSNGAGPQFTRATVTDQESESTAPGEQAITYDLAPYEPGR